MGLCIYSNGIIEEFNPAGETFTEEELSKSFDNFDLIRTNRLIEVPNTWCIWAEVDNPKDIEFNKIASEAVNEDVFSHIILIHDSEINLDWNMTDMILKSYPKFLEEIGDFINELMDKISIESQENYENDDNTSMIFLSALGHTEDKRVLFSFNPEDQHDSFFIDGGWDKFSVKIYEYLIQNYKEEPIEEEKPFVIFADTKTIVIIEDKYVDDVLNKIIKLFEKKEDYEKCSDLNNIQLHWKNRFSKNSEKKEKKRGRPRGSKNKNNNNENK